MHIYAGTSAHELEDIDVSSGTRYKVQVLGTSTWYRQVHGVQVSAAETDVNGAGFSTCGWYFQCSNISNGTRAPLKRSVTV